MSSDLSESAVPISCPTAPRRRLLPLALALLITIIAVAALSTLFTLKRDHRLAAPTSAPAATVLSGVPAGHPGNPNIVGVETILHYLAPATQKSLPYHRLMGLSGAAFVLQAQDNHEFQGMLDVGWWPMDSWAFYDRLEFLSRAIGWQLREVREIETEFRANPARFYARYFAPEVQASIAARKPLLGRHDQCFLILGYDDLQRPPLGRVACDTASRPHRLAGDPAYPWGLLVFDEPRPALEPDLADREALRYAVALATDQAPTPSSHHTTGQKSYAAWSAFLRDHDRPTQARHHDNMLLHLRLSRSAAVAYLADLAKRYPGEPATHLTAAADSYQRLLELSTSADTRAVPTDPQARDRLADLVDRLATLDARAANELQQAASHLAPK